MLSFTTMDVPLAQFMFAASRHLNGLQRHLGGATFLMIEVVLFCSAIIIGLLKGAMPPLGKATAVASATSIFAYLFNDSILKVAFGIPNPSDVIRGANHTIHWFSGSSLCSFPSGHMILSSSFAGVFVGFYRASFWPLLVILVGGAALLVVGGWHFVSDVIAGTFIGLSVGLVSAKRWGLTPSNSW